jgi:hypothetical protein
MQCFSWEQAEILLQQNKTKMPEDQWQLAIPEEDNNKQIGIVYLEKRIRITN